ncbi:hypothetical protein FRD01_22255 [Microvenator marinus]|uniref:Uncharacterized protein n=1 Tax=Microvenator marinus TaxID=2600177 RepID=A0A5B8XXI7_9DELT|nr:hypothetical protein [Microvenator marinus]QED29907.1 hypothetical protein FRD01_22255 [Microvenator marinus]
MSMFLRLEILPLTISRQSWAELWDTTSKVLNEWNLRLIRLGHRVLADVAVSVLTSPDDGEPGYWEVIGDQKSLHCAGSFGMSRDLVRYQRRARNKEERLFPNESSGNDPFVATVFENNYMGRPYALFLIAVGMLVEDAMGENAVLSGEFDWDDVLKAQTQLRRILGREFAPPHVTSHEWVRRRVQDQEVEHVHVPRKSAEHQLSDELYEKWFGGRPVDREFSKDLVEYASQTAKLAEQLECDRTQLLRLLAENLLKNQYIVRAETLDQSILRLDEGELRWLVSFTRQPSGCISLRGRIEEFIEDTEARRRLKAASVELGS